MIVLSTNMVFNTIVLLFVAGMVYGLSLVIRADLRDHELDRRNAREICVIKWKHAHTKLDTLHVDLQSTEYHIGDMTTAICGDLRRG